MFIRLKPNDLQYLVQAGGVAIKGQCVSSNTLSGRNKISREAPQEWSPQPALSLSKGHNP
ncbi:MAG: hypothetical protein WBE31_02130 [Candidatus Sulfotelmatobacter sp.]